MIRKRPHAVMGGVARVDRKGNKRNAQHLEQSQERKVTEATEFGKDPNGRRAVSPSLLLFPERVLI